MTWRSVLQLTSAARSRWAASAASFHPVGPISVTNKLYSTELRAPCDRRRHAAMKPNQKQPPLSTGKGMQ